MLFHQHSNKDYEYARVHKVDAVYQIRCIQCGELLPFKIVTAATGLTSFFAEPCLCGEQSLEAGHE